MIRKACLFVILIFTVSALVPAQERLAVLDTVLPEGIDRKVVIPITEKIMEEFVQSKLFIVVDRSFIEKTLSEMEFNLSDLVSNEAKLSEFGGFLKATYIVVSTVQRLDSRYFISAKMIEVKTGVIIAQASADKDGSSAVLIDMAGMVGEKLVLSAMGKPVQQSSNGTTSNQSGKNQTEVKTRKTSGSKAFGTVGLQAGLGLITMEVGNEAGGYDFFTLNDLDSTDAEIVTSLGFGIDARYPFGRYFYAGAAAGYAEYSYLSADAKETFVYFMDIAGLAGVTYIFGAFQPYIGVGLAFLIGGGEYLSSSGSVIEEYVWGGLPFGFELGLDYRFSRLLFAGLRYFSYSGFITSDSGIYDLDYSGSGLTLRFGIAF